MYKRRLHKYVFFTPPLSAFIRIWHNLSPLPRPRRTLLRSSKPMAPNKLHANKASSYYQLISSRSHQSLEASAMKFNTNMQSYSSDWTCCTDCSRALACSIFEFLRKC